MSGPGGDDESGSAEQAEAARQARRLEEGMPGEHLETNDLEDADHWLSVYREMLAFKEHVLGEAMEQQKRSREFEQELGRVDIPFLHGEVVRFHHRIGLWERRRAELLGSQR